MVNGRRIGPQTIACGPDNSLIKHSEEKTDVSANTRRDCRFGPPRASVQVGQVPPKELLVIHSDVGEWRDPRDRSMSRAPISNRCHPPTAWARLSVSSFERHVDFDAWRPGSTVGPAGASYFSLNTGQTGARKGKRSASILEPLRAASPLTPDHQINIRSGPSVGGAGNARRQRHQKKSEIGLLQTQLVFPSVSKSVLTMFHLCFALNTSFQFVIADHASKSHT